MITNTPFKLHFEGMHPRRRARTFAVHGLGYRELFRAKIVNRPNGTRDWLLMHFHSPVSIFAGGHMVEYSPGIPGTTPVCQGGAPPASINAGEVFANLIMD